MLRSLFLCVAMLLAGILTPSVIADDFPAESGTIPIAAWDVVPWQIINKPFEAGVVAFHETSVQVRFTISAGGRTIKQVQVDNPRLNPRTQIWEYVLVIDPTAIPDGSLEVVATCIPGGQGNRSVDLEPLRLFANATGKLGLFNTVFADASHGSDQNPGTADKPVQSLVAAVKLAGDGGIVHLMPGEYSPDQMRAGMKRQFWTTIRPAEGVQPDQVHIGKGRPSTDKLCLQNITLFADADEGRYNSILAGENGKNIIWLDRCSILNRKGRWQGAVDATGNRYEAYITGGVTSQIRNAPSALLMRNHRIEHISSDALTGVQTAINCSVIDIDPGPTKDHPDFHQSHVANSDTFNTNRILYNISGLDCKAQGFFGLNLKDSAFVNCLYVKKPDNAFRSQYAGKLDHVLFLHITLPNQSWMWRGNLKTRNCYMLNCILSNMSINSTEGADLTGMILKDNHFIGKNSTEIGTNLTQGDPHFKDPQSNDYTLMTTSPAAGNATRLQTVPADINGKPRAEETTDRGAFVLQ